MADGEIVPVATLRDRFSELEVRGEINGEHLAQALGWFAGIKPSGLPKPDGRRVLRTLGLAPDITKGKRSTREYIVYETAVQMAECLGMDPWEAGV